MIDIRKNILMDLSHPILIVSIMVLIVSVIFGAALPALVSSTLLFSSIDAVGFFHLLWGGDQFVKANNQHQRLVSYRFVQTAFQTTLSALMFSAFGWQLTAAFVLVWWFGLCDVIYYFLIRQNFFVFTDIYWIWWTPIGLLKSMGLFGRISGTTMFIQSILGIIVTITFLAYTGLQ